MWVFALGTLLAACLLFADAGEDSLRVMFWNLENYFDWRNDSTSVSDAEFSSRGARHWSRKRFDAKTQAIAKSILWIAGHAGGAPDIIGVAEVENRFVLRRLTEETLLRKLDYAIVHEDSPDPRGIDVALLYRKSRLQLVSAKACHLYGADTLIPTRDILLAQFTDLHGSDLAVLVNHHPSKWGGEKVSAPRRKAAVGRMKALADSLRHLGTERMIALGDFNDTPENPVYRTLDTLFVNLAEPLHKRGEGTIKYDGAWEMIDMVFVTPSCKAGPMDIPKIPFLLVEDRAHAGVKPLRTYSGPRYFGGVSDHCPVVVKIPLTGP